MFSWDIAVTTPFIDAYPRRCHVPSTEISVSDGESILNPSPCIFFLSSSDALYILVCETDT